MTLLIRNLLAVFLLFPAAVLAADYHIGTGQEYTSINDFPGWQSLNPGDHVYIHYGVYKEQIFLNRSGTAESPIIVEGVPDENGNLPEIDGDDAVIPSQYDGLLSEYDTGGGVLSQGHLIFIYRTQAQSFSYEPSYITIKNLNIHSATPELYTFTNTNGLVQAYPNASSCIYIKTGSNIVIENNIIHDCGNGIDVQGNEIAADNITVRGNYIYGNGRTDGRSSLEHNSYIEAQGSLYEYNVYGPQRTGGGGSALKDRSVGTVIRYNIIYAGARVMDIVEPQNLIEAGADPFNDPNYGNDWIYGNILINDYRYAPLSYSTGVLHYGRDGDTSSQSRPGPLEFYNNTIYQNQTSATMYNGRIFDVNDNFPILNLRNNAIVTTGTSIVNIGYSALTATTGVFNWLGGNWITTGFNHFYNVTGTWNETETIISGSNTGVLNDPANTDFGIPTGSPLIGIGVSLPVAYTTAGHNIDKQYKAVRTYMMRPDLNDAGAYSYRFGVSLGTVLLGQ